MNTYIIDVEANGLKNPTKIWCIIALNAETKDEIVWRDNITEFKTFLEGVDHIVGHNILSWDIPVLQRLLGIDVSGKEITDTLLVSRMFDPERTSHSIEAYGLEFGIEKGTCDDFTRWSEDLEERCKRDVEICSHVYERYRILLDNRSLRRSIRTEHSFQRVVDALNAVGFSFNRSRADTLLNKVTEELKKLDEKINETFKPKYYCIKVVEPRLTKYGTLNRTDFRWKKDNDLSEFNGGPFCRLGLRNFNPSSHKQIVDVLIDAGWRPIEKTKSHKEYLRLPIDKQDDLKYNMFRRYGWKINEENLATLPDSAPSPAKSLAKRILVESRRRTLTEWLGLVTPDERIHGEFMGIGAWTHRMAHQKPNTANIPQPMNQNGSVKLYGKEMRSLWRAPKNRLLIGVDAESIQLRIFAHYIDDKEFTDAITNGRKEDKTDPHSLNQRIIGDSCKSRAAAKRFIYALLLGAGIGKLAEVLECDGHTAREAYDRVLTRYSGFARLKESIIPRDGKRGYFIGLDGRRVYIPGTSERDRSHLCMSGYLQNGEAVVMKLACLKWFDDLSRFNAKLVNFVHDEWQTECPNNMATAVAIAEMQANSIRTVGEELGLVCPLKGSYWNEDNKDYTIGTNWYQTH